MKQKQLLTRFFVISVVFLGIYLGFEIYRSTQATMQMLSITQPIFHIQGKLINKSGQQLKIALESGTAAQPQKPTKFITIKTDGHTTFKSTSASIPFTRTPNTPNQEIDSSFEEILINSYLEVTTRSDIRVTNQHDLVATEVVSREFPAILTGKVLGVEGSRIKISGSLNNYNPFYSDLIKTGEFMVDVDDKTEITKYITHLEHVDPSKPVTPQASSLSDLATGQDVTSYFNLRDIINNQMIAKLILSTISTQARAAEVIPTTPVKP